MPDLQTGHFPQNNQNVLTFLPFLKQKRPMQKALAVRKFLRLKASARCRNNEQSVVESGKLIGDGIPCRDTLAPCSISEQTNGDQTRMVT